MPIYDYECKECGARYEEYRQIKDRDRRSYCTCGGTFQSILSFSRKFDAHYPFVDEYMDHRPVLIESLSQYRRELKKRGLQETGCKRGEKGQWI